MSKCSRLLLPTCVNMQWVTVSPCHHTSCLNWSTITRTSCPCQMHRDHGLVKIIIRFSSSTIHECISASLYVVGCLTGSLVGGYQCDYLGRKKSMLLDSAMMIVGFLSMGLAPNVELLLFGIITLYPVIWYIRFVFRKMADWPQ